MKETELIPLSSKITRVTSSKEAKDDFSWKDGFEIAGYMLAFSVAIGGGMIFFIWLASLASCPIEVSAEETPELPEGDMTTAGLPIRGGSDAMIGFDASNFTSGSAMLAYGCIAFFALCAFAMYKMYQLNATKTGYRPSGRGSHEMQPINVSPGSAIINVL